MNIRRRIGLGNRLAERRLFKQVRNADDRAFYCHITQSVQPWPPAEFTVYIENFDFNKRNRTGSTMVLDFAHMT